MNPSIWPDLLSPADAIHVQRTLEQFWNILATLPDLIQRRENLLAADATARLRRFVLEMMLALNGVAYPTDTRHLNTYLSDTQRAAVEKTLLMPTVGAESWIGQAVALVVIYRWYAPQLVEKYGLRYPRAAEEAAWLRLRGLPDWPLVIATE
ncbi:MAG: hypothetical protein NZ553_19120 [Caldilinea sp.]|nr:hypothetical protein [Caldilinea sp.]MDW8442593.1 hypothetical protein [Caldilineaceae bacterium]